jgi:hypothetical protein
LPLIFPLIAVPGIVLDAVTADVPFPSKYPVNVVRPCHLEIQKMFLKLPLTVWLSMQSLLTHRFRIHIPLVLLRLFRLY